MCVYIYGIKNLYMVFCIYIYGIRNIYYIYDVKKNKEIKFYQLSFLEPRPCFVSVRASQYKSPL